MTLPLSNTWLFVAAGAALIAPAVFSIITNVLFLRKYGGDNDSKLTQSLLDTQSISDAVMERTKKLIDEYDAHVNRLQSRITALEAERADLIGRLRKQNETLRQMQAMLAEHGVKLDVLLDSDVVRRAHDIHALYDLIDNGMGLEDLKGFIFRLDMEFEKLPGEEKGEKLREFLKSMQRQRRLDRLLEVGRIHYGWIDWPS